MSITSNRSFQHISFWLIFLLVQSFLFGGVNAFRFYLVKNLAIVSLQALIVYFNFRLLIPHLLLTKRYLFYFISAVTALYLTYAISFDIIGFSFSTFFPEVFRSGPEPITWWPTSFWSALSGSAPYSLMLLASTVFYLIRQNNSAQKPDSLSKTSGQINQEEDTLMLKEGKVIHRLNIHDILYVQGMKEYVSWHTADKKLITLHSLASLEKLLGSKGFLRTHKSFIVNTKCVNAIRYDSLDVPGSKIPIGRSYRVRVQDCFQSEV